MENFINEIITRAFGHILGVHLNKLIINIYKQIKNVPNIKERVSSFVEWYYRYLIEFTYIYIVPPLFITSIYLDPKYNLQEKHIFAIGFCAFAMIVGTVLNWAKNNNDNQQEVYTLK